MTTQGSYWLSSAVKGEYARALHSGDADEIEAELIAAYRTGRMNFIGNIELGRDFGSNRESGLSVGSAVQATYKFNKHLTPGVEWHADYGKLNKFGDDDGHYVGPIVTGELMGLGKGELEYTVGYYWGVAGETKDNAARVQIAYEFAF